MKRLFAWSAAFIVLLLPVAPAVGQADHPGYDLYKQTCSTCHGSTLEGGLGPSLIDDEWLHGAGRDAMRHVIQEGSGEMPAFSSILGDEQIDTVIDYIHAVKANPDLAPQLAVDTLATLDYALSAEVFVDGLDNPWALDFINAQSALITERPGSLWQVKNGRRLAEAVSGTPEVHYEGQGGLLDVTVDPEYAENGWIYLAYSHGLDPVREGDKEKRPAMTRIVRGRIENNAWVDQQVLFEAPHETYLTTGVHYGSRIVFDPAGYLYFSIGDRGKQDMAQDLTRPNGKVHRIHRDGSIPQDNPFVTVSGAIPSIYSYGHRNPQGVTVDPRDGTVWTVEHGPMGGDELNQIKPGRNYGWPVITYGINYNGTVITRDRKRGGMEQPVMYWRPSIATSGLAFYSGDVFPLWRNHLILGALKDQAVRMLDVHDERVMHEEVILKDAGRVREAVPGPDGAIYVVLNGPDQVVRLVPREERLTSR